MNKYIQMVEQRKGQRDMLQSEISTFEKQKIEQENTLKDITEAQKIMQIVAKETQDNIKYHICDPVTMALQDVFGKNYRFIMEYSTKRSGTECAFYIQKGKENRDILDGGGGGAADIVAFGLRVSLWKLANKDRNTFIMDEPFTNVSSDLMPKVGKMLQKLSRTLGIQFIIIKAQTDTVLKEYGDKCFNIINNNGVSDVW